MVPIGFFSSLSKILKRQYASGNAESSLTSIPKFSLLFIINITEDSILNFSKKIYRNIAELSILFFESQFETSVVSPQVSIIYPSELRRVRTAYLLCAPARALIYLNES